MKIVVCQTPGWASPYGPKGALVPLPARMRFLAPDAYQAILPLAGQMVFTDVFRSPAASAEARATKRGVAKPGRSAHNFAFAVDADVRRTLRAMGLPATRAGKAKMDAAMADAGWLCYRKDHALDESEAWHYTFGVTGHGSAAIEAAIQAWHGRSFTLTPTQAQEALAKCRLYQGAIDGDFGRQSRAALDVFKRGWQLRGVGLDAETQRLLAVVAADLEVVPAPGNTALAA